jgi:leucyl aminopeptidase (aminopeptidase T)
MKIAVRFTVLVTLALAMLTSGTAAAQNTQADTDSSISANVGDPAKFRQMMTSLQQAVATHDASAVATLVSYPITVNPRTKRAMRIRTPEAFVARYDKIVTPHIADVIQKQKYEDLFVNYQGAMFGSGEIWIAGICKDKECKQSDIRIRTIQNQQRSAATH